MPNWCENKLTVSGLPEEIKRVRPYLLRENPQTETIILDFNCFIPMPEALQIPCGSLGEKTQALLVQAHNAAFDDEVIEKFVFPYKVDEVQALFLSLKAREMGWTIGGFIQWLKEDSTRQDELGFDLPLGRLYVENQIKYGSANWYDWAYSHWGCKWNANTQYITEEKDYIICDFDTLWGPPEIWFDSLCETYPCLLLRLDYYEPGCNIAGSIENTDGHSSHKQFNDEEMREFALKVFGYCFDDVETE
ncbi:hypothetical protein [Rodentibacter trehalosifermentans]|uniref:DUF1281 family ferredoxin-like fold protein n=1 Tax=Rodentibacter trehalosifermentans TaxID=1908263 RepID=UPI000984BDA2|nr:hypothetical protein [Rodentibacter trehalosifermentans]OOF52319.1 hypothetical protein BKK53_06005 [Rodentibacter trehalosifermentans]